VTQGVRPGLTRRGFLAAAGASLAVTEMPGAGSWASVLAARAASLGGPGLLRSYDVAGLSDFDKTQANCAYVYDNAVAGLALLAAGDEAGARRIGDALVQAQKTDRFWHDGRLRNAYRAGPSPAQGDYPLAGWWDGASARWVEDRYQAGTATGVMGWAMLLWIGLGGAYRAPALRAADFIETHLRGPRGYAGGFFGFEPVPQRVDWVSTEHNIDLAASFAALGRADSARHAAAFVASMWQAEQGCFAMGLHPDGSLNRGSAIDANLWPLLAAGANPAWRASLPWVLRHHGLPANQPLADIEGVDFNTDRDGIWLEGTAITALVCKRQGMPGAAARFMATLRGNTAPGGLIYASTVPRLTTGLSTGLKPGEADFFYYRRPHIAPTAWAVLAELGANPFPA
jgi:hypothetical protein